MNEVILCCRTGCTCMYDCLRILRSSVSNQISKENEFTFSCGSVPKIF